MVTTSTPDMRQELLDAALDILNREGAAGLTVRNITERAGCSTTGIYTYFGGKHGLLDAIVLDGFASFDAELSPHYRRGDLIAAGRAYRRWALANPTHYLVMFARAVPDFEPGEAAARSGAAAYQALVDALEAAGAETPESAAYHVYATSHGYVMLELGAMAPIGEKARLDELHEAGLRRTLDAIGLR